MDLLLYTTYIYARLEGLNVPGKAIATFRDVILRNLTLEDFAEDMAGYAMGIIYLSKTTKYSTDQLWEAWTIIVQEGMEDDNEISYLWDDFREVVKKGGLHL